MFRTCTTVDILWFPFLLMICWNFRINGYYNIEYFKVCYIGISFSLLKHLCSLFLCLCSFPESVLESPSQSFHISHPSCSSGAPALGLFTPVIIPHFLGWVCTWRTSLLLDMEGHFPTTPACRVGFVVSFSEWSGTLCLLYIISMWESTGYPIKGGKKDEVKDGPQGWWVVHKDMMLPISLYYKSVLFLCKYSNKLH